MVRRIADSRVALITGGGSGIGAATARQLLERGWRVAITGRREDRLRDLADALGRPPELSYFAGDAADLKTVQVAVESTINTYGRLDAAVASAGYTTFDSIADGDPNQWRDMVLTNVLAPALLINVALPALRRVSGRIVLVGSVAGVSYSPGNLYGATKWALVGMAENTRLSVTREGVGVTLVNPGATDTDFFAADGGPPDRPLLSPGQLADAIVWALHQPTEVDVGMITIRPFGSPL